MLTVRTPPFTFAAVIDCGCVNVLTAFRRGTIAVLMVRVVEPPNATPPPPLRPSPAPIVTPLFCSIEFVTPAGGIASVTSPLAPPPVRPAPAVTPVIVPLPPPDGHAVRQSVPMQSPFALMLPATSSVWVGLFVPMPTPPEARIRNSLGLVDVNALLEDESAQTKAPSCAALACQPAARLSAPAATLLDPPGTPHCCRWRY